MLQKIRQIIAFLFFCIITLLFLDFTGTLHAWFGWMAKIQFLPAVLTLNAGVRTHLLFRHLPIRCLSGHRGADRTGEEETALFVFESKKRVALQRVGGILGTNVRRIRFDSRIRCPL